MRTLFHGLGALFLCGAAWTAARAADARDATAPDAGRAELASTRDHAAVSRAAIIYVRASAAGANNGTSWANAYTALYTALAAAGPGAEIWVAAGTYKPTAIADRGISFELESGVGVYGGFNGSETLRSQRNWTANETVLSGNIGAGGGLDNSYNVVHAGGVDSTAVLDGFTIYFGVADVTPFAGGGMYNENGSPTLANLTFVSNQSLFSGGGMYNVNGSPRLTNVWFNNNDSTFGSGAGLYTESGSPILTNVTFTDNDAAGNGGGMYVGGGGLKLTNGLFIGNEATSGGGIYGVDGSTPVITNVTVAGSLGGGGMRAAGTIRNTIVWGNTGGDITAAAPGTAVSYSLSTSVPPAANAGNNVIGADPLFVDLPHRNARLFPGSPAIDAGNDSAIPAGVTTDLDGQPRIRGDAVDMGAYESCVGQWVDATPPVLADPGVGQGAAWGDYDSDGLADLYLVNAGSANKLFRNLGGGAFTDATSPPLNASGPGHGVAWGDYNNDGRLDLYLVNDGSANKLFRNNGGGSFTDVTAAPLGDTGPGTAAAWADYNADGWLDLYLANESPSPNKLFRNNAGVSFTDVTSGPLGETASSHGVAWGDYDNDGRPDLFLANFDAPNKLLRNTGGGVFTDATGALGGSGGATGADWGDYDNDGDLDLYVPWSGTTSRLYRNNGNGTFTDVTAAPIDVTDALDAAWGDYDNDGLLDLYVGVGGASPANKLFHNEGGGVFNDATVPTLADTGSSSGVAWADADDDGSLDLYAANAAGPNRLMRSIPGEAQCALHWLQIDLVGTPGFSWPGIPNGSNVAAIGARVRVVAGDLSMIREISGGSGVSQGSATAEFGIWANTSVDTIEVRWPSGLVETWRSGVTQGNIPIDTRITLVEGGIVVDVNDEPRTPTAYRLHANVPNPFNPMTTIRYDLPTPGRVYLRIFDVAGRTVRTLIGGEHRDTGEHQALWDGHDDSGRAVAAGMYFYELDASSFRGVRKMVLVR
jgi:predicted outer membrane repeat protein